MKLEGRSLVAQVERHRTSLALMAVVGICLLLAHWFWLEPILIQKQELSENIAQQQAMIQKYQEKLAQGTVFKESLTKQEQELGQLQRKVFRGEDSYQLAAKLGDIVSAKGSQDLNVKSYQVFKQESLKSHQSHNLEGFVIHLSSSKIFSAHLINFSFSFSTSSLLKSYGT